MPPPIQPISRKTVVLVIVVCFLVSALAIPVALHLPKWIEAEIVLGTWWLVWIAALSWLLFHGHVVDDDTSKPEWSSGKSEAFFQTLDATFHAGSCCLSEGIATVLFAMLALLLFGLALFLLVEFVIPAIVVLLLISIGGMLARAVNDTHDCEGSFGMSLIWGFLWATVYTGPVAVIILLVVIALQNNR